MGKINHTINPIKAAVLSIISNTLLIILKIVVSILTGSVSILSEAFHSLSDLIASFITWLSLKYSENPPDEKHPYGHKKIENVTASIEAILVLLAAAYIFYESILRILEPVKIDYLYLALAIMSISAIVNFVVSTYLYRIARATQSLALEGDALHLRADMFSSFAVVIGFLVIIIFEWYIVDTILAIIVAIYMTIESIILFKKAFNPLLDESASSNDIRIINEYINANNYNIHSLKTRKAGNIIFAEFHLELPSNFSLQQVHDICDIIENDLKERISNLQITIHVEPIEK